MIDANDPNFAELGSFVSKDDFVKELLKPDGKVTKGKEKKVNGVDCVALKGKDGTFYFDKKDGRPVSLVTTEDGKGTLNFTYGKVDDGRGALVRRGHRPRDARPVSAFKPPSRRFVGVAGVSRCQASSPTTSDASHAATPRAADRPARLAPIVLADGP